MNFEVMYKMYEPIKKWNGFYVLFAVVRPN